MGRYSLGTGMPFLLQEQKCEETLKRPPVAEQNCVRERGCSTSSGGRGRGCEAVWTLGSRNASLGLLKTGSTQQAAFSLRMGEHRWKPEAAG